MFSVNKLFKHMSDVLYNLFSKPSSLKDYVAMGDVYVSRRLLCIIAAGLLTAGVSVKEYLIPYLEGRLWIPTIVINTNKYHTYSGKARVVSKDGMLIYRGDLDNGEVTGLGELFDSRALVYEGEFLKNNFSGGGKLYDTDGNLKYQGVFENGSYKEGSLYFKNGPLKYEGSFEDNLYNQGKLYFENGNLMYEGVFDTGGYKEGKLYLENGNLLYEGGFMNNRYNGAGKLFDGGFCLYDGGFSDNLYNGYGKLYKPYTDNLLYEGEFEKGQYDGYGDLYFHKGGRIMYAGDFSRGLYSGDGVLYNIQGREIYKGAFFKGGIDYIPFVDKDIETIRSAFGEERRLITLSNSFLLVYDDMRIMFEFSYADEESEPTIQRIKLLGEQAFEGVRNGMTADAFRGNFETDIFTEYLFIVNEEDEIPFGFVNSRLKENDEAYSIKYNLESVYVRAFFEDMNGFVVYFEIGGI